METSGVVFVFIAMFFAAVCAFVCVPLFIERRQHRKRQSCLRARVDNATEVLAGDRKTVFSHVMKPLARLAQWLPPLAPLFSLLSKQQREEKTGVMRQQLPRALYSLSISLGSGKSALQAFAYAAKNTPPPLKEELQQTVWDMQAGKSLGEALSLLEARSAIPEITFVTVAFTIQNRSGGSLKGVLDTATESIKDSIEMQRDIKVKTAQARLSARVVGLMPVVLVILLFVISPDYLASFFGTGIGFGLFVVAVILDLAGLLCIRRILRLDGAGGRGGRHG